MFELSRQILNDLSKSLIYLLFRVFSFSLKDIYMIEIVQQPAIRNLCYENIGLESYEQNGKI